MKTFLVVIGLGFILGLVGVVVDGKSTFARQSTALQDHFEKRIQELTDSNKDYIVGYFENGTIGSIFVLRDPNSFTGYEF